MWRGERRGTFFADQVWGLAWGARRPSKAQCNRGRALSGQAARERQVLEIVYYPVAFLGMARVPDVVGKQP